MGELLDRLREDAAVRWGAAPAWHPTDEGQGIEGRVLAIDNRPGEGRRTDYPVITVELDDGTRCAWHAAGEIAAEQLELHRPAVGHRIAILYGGETSSKSGSRYKRWAVAVGRPATEQPPAADPNDPRTRIAALVNGQPDEAFRHRIKRTFARRFGVARNLDDTNAIEALAWVERAIAGAEQLEDL